MTGRWKANTEVDAIRSSIQLVLPFARAIFPLVPAEESHLSIDSSEAFTVGEGVINFE